MRRLALGALLLGGVALAVSLVAFGWLIWDAAWTHEAYRGPLGLGTEVITDRFDVRTDQLVQVGVRMRIEAEARKRRAFDDDDANYDLVYTFPVEYEVTAFDADGAATSFDVVSTAVDHANYSMSHGRDFVRRTGGWRHGTFWFEKFPVPATTRTLSVRLRIDPDDTHGASAEQLELIVADDVSSVVPRLVTAIVSLVLGIALIVVGALLFAFGVDATTPVAGADVPTNEDDTAAG